MPSGSASARRRATTPSRQAQINALLVRLAREGKRVARLKGGDPMVFGRAGEEIAALRKAGIAYHDRAGRQRGAGGGGRYGDAGDAAQGFDRASIFATAHGADDDELDHWAALAGSGLTLALYMGKSIAARRRRRRLMRARHDAGDCRSASWSMPGAAIASLYRGTLGELAVGRRRDRRRAGDHFHRRGGGARRLGRCGGARRAAVQGGVDGNSHRQRADERSDGLSRPRAASGSRSCSRRASSLKDEAEARDAAIAATKKTMRINSLEIETVTLRGRGDPSRPHPRAHPRRGPDGPALRPPASRRGRPCIDMTSSTPRS